MLLRCCLAKHPTLNLKVTLLHLDWHRKRTTSSLRIWLKSRHSTGRTNLFQLPIVNLRRHIINVACLQKRWCDFENGISEREVAATKCCGEYDQNWRPIESNEDSLVRYMLETTSSIPLTC